MPSQGKSPRLPSGSRRLPSPRSVSTVSGRSATSDDTDDSRMGYSSSVAPSSVSSRRVPFPDSLPAAMSSANPPPELLRDSVVEQHDSNGDGRGQSESGSRSSPQLAAHAPAVPTDPMPDSLLTRSTFAALEHSAGTLKRLAKHVLASSSTMFALLEQLESAEDDLLMHLGELGRWLEGGYGVTGEVWDSDGGIRKVAREKRARDREELEVMVSHSLEAVKGEIKRQGLAGHGAQTKFEVSKTRRGRIHKCGADPPARALQSNTTRTPQRTCHPPAGARRPVQHPMRPTTWPRRHVQHSLTSSATTTTRLYSMQFRPARSAASTSSSACTAGSVPSCPRSPGSAPTHTRLSPTRTIFTTTTSRHPRRAQ